MASTDPQFRALPAPWTCKGAHAWWFFTSLGLPSFGSGTPKLHPSYFYDGGAGQKDFVGGPATLMLLRYDSTPAGPYDELLVVPGRFKSPQEVARVAREPASLRITRIYVSNLTTTFAGRTNWNIPKQLASFDFKHLSPTQAQVRVFASNSSAGSFASEPFFAATVTSSAWCPAIPFDTKVVPMSLQMAQPPLHSSANVKHDAEVATEHWKILTPRFKAKARLATIAPALTSGSSTTKTFADNESFPNTKPYSVGFELQDFVAIFDVGTEVQMH